MLISGCWECQAALRQILDCATLLEDTKKVRASLAWSLLGIGKVADAKHVVSQLNDGSTDGGLLRDVKQLSRCCRVSAALASSVGDAKNEDIFCPNNQLGLICALDEFNNKV